MNLKDLFFSFEGRILRKDWWIVMVTIHVAAFLALIMPAIVIAEIENPFLPAIISILMLVSAVAIIWSYIACCVKRFHDHDKPGTWVLISLIPTIGTVWILIECGCLPGTEGDNSFGEAPKG